MSKIIKLTVLLTLTLLFTNRSNAQKVNPKVREAFHQKFPAVSTVHWGKENAHEYEAEFHMNGRTVSANFNLNGTWMETETDINKKSLPVAVVEYLNKHYSNKKLGEIARTESPKQTVYEVAVEKGEQNITLIFSIDGKLIHKEAGGDAD